MKNVNSGKEYKNYALMGAHDQTVKASFNKEYYQQDGMGKIEVLIASVPLYSEDLGIELTKPSGRFKWFLASILFGARISEKIAMNTYRTFEKYGVLSHEKILDAGWDELVRILDEGGYVRYDFSTATKLLNIMKELKEKYGSLEELYANSRNTEELKSKLMEFKGIGEVTAQIFLRELRGVWKIDVPVSVKAAEMAQRLEINIGEFEGEKLTRVEDALVKLYLRGGKKGKYKDTLPPNIHNTGLWLIVVTFIIHNIFKYN